jgi:WD40 repeat protein
VHELKMEFGLFSEDVSPDGSLLVDQGPGAGTVNVRDLRAGALVRTIDAHADTSLAAAFAPDGKRLLFSGYDRKGRKSVPYLIDVAEGRLVGRFPVDLFGVAYSPDGRRVLGVRHVPIPGSIEWKLEIVIVDAQTGRPFAVFGKWQAKPALLKAAFLPDGRVLCADTRTLTTWGADDGHLARSIPIDADTDQVAFSTDLRFALAVDFGVRRPRDPMPVDRPALRVYDLKTGQAVRTWRGPWPPH